MKSLRKQVPGGMGGSALLAGGRAQLLDEGIEVRFGQQAVESGVEGVRGCLGELRHRHQEFAWFGSAFAQSHKFGDPIVALSDLFKLSQDFLNGLLAILGRRVRTSRR